MKSLRQLGAVLVLLVSTAVPSFACMAPGAGTSAAERICCRAMKSVCGRMQMSGPQGCCTQVPATPHDTALRADSVPLHWLVAVEERAATLDLFPRHDAASGRLQSLEHSPPKPPPSIVSSLRV